MAFADGATGVIGTPDDLVVRIRDLYELTGGFGVAIGFVHDWANIENTRRSWDLVARYVVPEVKGMLDPLRRSQRHVIENREYFVRARDAVVTKIMQNERAAAALDVPPTARSPLVLVAARSCPTRNRTPTRQPPNGRAGRGCARIRFGVVADGESTTARLSCRAAYERGRRRRWSDR